MHLGRGESCNAQSTRKVRRSSWMRESSTSLTVGDVRHGGGSLFFGVLDRRNLLRTAPIIDQTCGTRHAVVVIPPKQKAGAETRVVGGGGGGGSGSGMHGASSGFLNVKQLGWLLIGKGGKHAHKSSSRRPTQKTTCWNKADSSPDGM